MPVFLLALASVSMGVASAQAQTPVPAHDNFRVAIYIPVAIVERMKDPAYLEKSWDEISSQVKVDKVYIESYRSGVTADDALLEAVKSFFVAHGVKVAGGIAFAAGGDTAGSETIEAGQFVSFSYTDPKSRAYVKNVSELTARHFDEIILDDFFFNNTKRDSDIAGKGTSSWTAFRLRLMDEASRNLVVGPAKAVNPKVKVIIKFPNWYEHFQANGYDLDQEPKIFDGIYTGTETRDPVVTDQHLQQYESYQIVRYFDNVAPGRNGGGWVDTFDARYLDRYAEQLWDTMLAKAPEIMLFQWSALAKPAEMGNRAAWAGLETSFNEAGLEKWRALSPGAVNYATVAGYSLATVDAVIGKLGKPIGIASYKPYQTSPDDSGEDFLHNYLGMIGIPIDLHPQFPADAGTVLLTESAKGDPAIVNKIKAHLEKGCNVIITSGLLRALEAKVSKPLDQIVELHATGRVLKTTEYWGAVGAGGGASLGSTPEILIPEIDFQTNDAWPVVRGTAEGRGAPLLIMDHYSKGILYVLTIPENPTDLYALPQPALTAIKQYLLRDFPVQIDAPSRVSLFAYDNHSLVVESFRDEPVKVTVSTTGSYSKLRNLATGEVVERSKPSADASQSASTATSIARRRPPQAERTEFKIELAPHSFAAFVEE
jgi:hypothetical protein